MIKTESLYLKNDIKNPITFYTDNLESKLLHITVIGINQWKNILIVMQIRVANMEIYGKLKHIVVEV